MFSLIIDQQLSLALLHSSFAPALARLADRYREDLSQWLAWPQHCRTEDDFLTFIRTALHRYADGGAMNLSMFYQGVLVGNISFNTIDQTLKKAELGYWLAPSARGKGIVTHACQALFTLGFDTLGLEKMEIHVATGNTASRAVCERLGMRQEGILARAKNLNGRIVDHAIYGLSKANHSA